MRSIIVALVLLVMPGIAWSAPQYDPAASQSQDKNQNQDQSMQSATGELTRVDAQEQLLWIKTAAGEEMQFSYTKDTPISGSGKTVEGLQDMSGGGTQVKVQYEIKGGANRAVKIEIQSQSS